MGNCEDAKTEVLTGAVVDGGCNIVAGTSFRDISKADTVVESNGSADGTKTEIILEKK